MTKYSPKVVNTIFEKMSEGYSLVAAAAFADVGRRTVYEWIDQHPEFAETYALAQAKRQLWWETEALTTNSGPRVTMITKALGGMRSADWSDDSRLEITGAGGSPLIQQISFAILDPRTEDIKTIDHEPEDKSPNDS